MPPRDEEGDTKGALATIAENLHRRELPALERNELLAEWVRLRQLKEDQKAADEDAATKPREVRGVSGRGIVEGRGNKGGVEQASRDLGIPATNLRQATKIADLPAETKQAAKDLGLSDNQSALLAAAKVETTAAQVAILQDRAKPKPQYPEEPDPIRAGVGRLWRAWDDEIEEVQEAFRTALLKGGAR